MPDAAAQKLSLLAKHHGCDEIGMLLTLGSLGMLTLGESIVSSDHTATDFPLSDYLFFVGPKSSGKSNYTTFLKAMVRCCLAKTRMVCEDILSCIGV